MNANAAVQYGLINPAIGVSNNLTYVTPNAIDIVSKAAAHLGDGGAKLMTTIAALNGNSTTAVPNITANANVSTTPATHFGNGGDKLRTTIAAFNDYVQTTTVESAGFLGIAFSSWMIMLGVVCGVILLVLLLLALCCLCCSAAEDDEQKKKAAAAAKNPATQTTTSATPLIAPVATETVIEKHTNHLPDGRQITTINSVRTTTSSNGTKNRKTSRVHLLSQKSSKHRRHPSAHRRQQKSSRPRPSSRRHPSSRRPHPSSSQQQNQQLPIIRSKTPRSNDTVVEMGAVPEPPTYQSQSSRRAPPSSSNYSVEPQPQIYPY